MSTWIVLAPVLADSAIPSLNEEPQESSGYGQHTFTKPLPPDVLLEVDPVTGRERVLLERSDWLRIITDREGRPRLGLAAAGKRRRYFYRDSYSRKWVLLEKVVKDEEPHGFTVTPENMLEPRSVPLGFDYDGSTLYYASNINHDTFALRALDMSTGRSKDAVISIERVDLVEPTDLVREDVLVFDPHRFVHAAENAYVPVTMGRALHRALKRQDPENAYLELRGEGHGGWSGESTERLFAELGRFFNATIYNYSVEVGPATVEPSD